MNTIHLVSDQERSIFLGVVMGVAAVLITAALVATHIL